MVTFIFVVIGVCIGSFGNVLIDRLPAGRSIVGRSKCDGCGRTLSPLELVPILSYVFLRGRCRTCKTPISARLPLVEIVSGVLGFLALWKADHDILSAGLLLLALWALFLIAVIDLKTKTIPDVLTAVVFLCSLAFHFVRESHFSFVSVLIGAGFFLLLWLVSRGRWVGSGDILLAGAIGMLVSDIGLMVWALMVSYIVGAGIAVVLLLTKKLHRGSMVPFGPFLVLAAFIVFFFGEYFPPLPF